MEKNGFSLVELSIVLVILGLLTGGILSGRNLIHAAELRSVMQEYTTYTTSINTFREKYRGLPGDLTNAEAFWGTMSSGTCPRATGGVGTETCNGNGDGIIEIPVTAGESGEMYTVWQHLANADMIAGTFTGIAGPNSRYHDLIGVNVPASKYNNGAWSVDEEVAPSSFMFDVNVDRTEFSMGRESTGSDADEKIFTPADLWNIDKKVDDGKPARGKVIGRFWDDCTDAANQQDYDAEYLLQEESEQCSMIVLEAM